MISLYKGEPKTINVVFPSDPLVSYGFTHSDITNITMNFKLNTDTDADAAYLEKVQGSGASYNTGTFTFTMAIDIGDTSGLKIGSYELCLGVEINGTGDYIELSIPEPFITIIADKVRK